MGYKDLSGDILISNPYKILDVDKYGFDKIKKFPYNWIAETRQNRVWYAKATEYQTDSKRGTVRYMHQIIMGTYKKNVIVDHIDRNGLNNRLENLRLVTKQANTRNRKGANSNNKSGHRNVAKIGNWWVVQLMVDGKNTPLAKFKDVDDAGEYAERKRNEIYGEFAGIG